MAKDWIKMRMDLPSHPKVVRILSATKSDKFRVIGGLHAVWSVFDVHSEDGTLDGYTPETMDHIIGWDGFCKAMMAVGWLDYDGEESLAMPDFDTHNGQSAKRRADETERKRKERNNADKLRTSCGQGEDKKRSRGEESRVEEKKTTTMSDTPAGDAEPAVVLLPTNKHNTEGEEYPVTQSQIDEWQEVYPAVNCLAETKQAKLWLKANPAKRKTYGGMAKFLNSWMARQQNKGGSSVASQSSPPRPSHRNEMPKPDRPERK